MQNDQCWLRHRIYRLFPDSSDLDAFLIDFFPDVYATVSAGMTRVALVSHLFKYQDMAAITEALEQISGQAPEKNARRRLRKRIDRQCPTCDDLEALLVDFFRDIQQKTSSGMTKAAQVNLLFMHIDPQKI